MRLRELAGLQNYRLLSLMNDQLDDDELPRFPSRGMRYEVQRESRNAERED